MADFNLNFKADTSDLERIPRLLAELSKVFKGLSKSINATEDQSETMQKSFNKMADDFKNGVAKQFESSGKLVDKTLAELAKSSKKVKGSTDEMTEGFSKVEKMIIRQKDILSALTGTMEGVNSAFTKGESSLLSTAKAAGASKRELKELSGVLKSIRDVTGQNPFDNSIDGIEKLQKAIKLVKLQRAELRKENGLSKSAAEDLLRVEEQANIKYTKQAQQMGLSKQAMKEFVSEGVIAAKNQFLELNKVLQENIQKNEEISSKISAKLQKEQAQINILADTERNTNLLNFAMEKGLSIQTADFILTQKALGVKDKQIKAYLDSAQAIREYNTALANSKVQPQVAQAPVVKAARPSTDLDSAVGTFRNVNDSAIRQAQVYQEALNLARVKGISISEATFIVEKRLAGVTEENVNVLLAAKNAISTYTAAQDKKKQADLAAAEAARKNQEAIEKQKAATEDFRNNVINSLEKDMRKLQVQQEVLNKGFNNTTANGIFKIREASRQLGTDFTALESKYLSQRKAIEKLEKDASKVGGTFKGLATILRSLAPSIGAVGIGAFLGAGARQFVEISDSMNLLRSRIKLVSEEGTNVNEVLQQITNTAVENRTSIQEVGTLYTRLIPALKQFGMGASETTLVVDSFSKSLLISGANVQETSSAILQFSQAMASGKLAGDEFRSISEAAPEFLRRFSEATGIAAGSLKELASDGKLTTEVITAAMILMNESIRKAAQGIDITFGQSVKILVARLTEGADKFEQATGFTKALAQGIFQLSESIAPAVDSLIKIVQESKAFYDSNKDLINDVLYFSTVLVGANLALKVFAATKVAAIGAIAAYQAGVKLVTGAMFILEGALYGSAAAAKVLRTALITTGIGALAVGLGYLAAEILFSNEQTEDLSNKQREAKEAIAATEEQIETSRKTIKKLTDGMVGTSKETEKLITQNEELKVQLSLVGKSAEEQAAARKILALAQADNLELQASELLLTGNLDQAQRDLAFDLINRAEALRENAKLTYQLAISQSKQTKATKDTKDEYQSFSEKLDETFRKLTGLNDSETEASKLSRDLLKIRKELTKAQLADAEAKIKSLDALEKFLEAEKKAVDTGDELGKIMKEASESSEAQVKELENTVIALEKQNEQYGLTETEIAKNILKEYEYQVAMGKTGDDIERRIELQKRLVKALENKAQLDATEESYKVILDESEKFREEANKAAEELEKGLTDAFQKAFIEGQSLSKAFGTAIKSQVFKITLEPVFKDLSKVLADQINGVIKQVRTSVDGVAGEGATNALLLNSNTVLKGFKEGVFQGAQAAAGAVIGNAFGGPIGSIVGAKIGEFTGKLTDKLLGIRAGETRQGQSFRLEDGKVVKAVGPSGGSIAESETSAATLAVIQSINDGFKQLGSSTVVTSFLSGLESSDKGRGGVFSGGTLSSGATFGESRNIGGVGGFESNSPTSLNSGEALKLYVEDLNQSFLQALQTESLNFESNIRDYLSSLGNVELIKGSALENAILVIQQLDFVNDNFKELGGNLADLSGASVETISNFFNAVGGLEALGNSLSNFNQKFLTESEKQDILLNQLTKSFQSLNIPLPKTREEFKNLVKTQEVLTESGARTYSSLLNLTDAIDQLYPVTEDLKESIRSAADIGNERISLENRLLQLQGDTTELRRRELASLDPSNRSLQERIFALEDEKEAMDKVNNEFKSLTDELFQLTATEEQKIAKQRQALSESNRAIFDQIQAIKKLKSEQQKADEAKLKQIEEQKAAVQRVSQIGKSIADYLRKLDITEASLSPQQRLQGASSEFNRLLGLAKNGDEGASQEITSASDNLLSAARDFYGSSEPFQNILRTIKSELGALPAVKTYEEKVLEVLGDIKTGIDTLNDDFTISVSIEAKSELEKLITFVTDTDGFPEDLRTIALKEVLPNALKTVEAILADDNDTQEVKRLAFGIFSEAPRTLKAIFADDSITSDVKKLALETLDTTQKTLSAIFANDVITADVKKLALESLTTSNKIVSAAFSTDGVTAEVKKLAIGTLDLSTKTIAAILDNSTATNEAKKLAIGTLDQSTKTIAAIFSNDATTNDVKKLALDGQQAITKTIAAVFANDTITNQIKTLAFSQLAQNSVTLGLIFGTDGLTEQAKRIAVGTLTNTVAVDAILASNIDADLKALLLADAGYAQRALSVSAALSATTNPELKKALENTSKDYLVLLDAALKDGVITADERKLLDTQSESVQKTVNTALNTPVLTEDQRKQLYQGTESVSKTINGIISTGTIGSEQRALLLQQAESVTKTVNAILSAGSFTADQRTLLLQQAESVTKTVNASISAGFISQDSRDLLKQANENVSKTVSAFISSPSLTQEQKDLLRAIAGNTTGTVNITGAVTFNPNDPLKSVFDAIQANTKTMADAFAINGTGFGAEIYKMAVRSAGSGLFVRFSPESSDFRVFLNDIRGGIGNFIRVESVNRSGQATFFENGGAFSGGAQMFANGGAFTNSIVSTPTAFNMGVMGEAGPEAIMPLARSSDGSLGVRIVGGMSIDNSAMVNMLDRSNRNLEALIRLQQFSNQQIIERLEAIENTQEEVLRETKLQQN